LLTEVVKLIRRYENSPSFANSNTLRTAQRAVTLHARKLSKCSPTTDTKARRKHERALFYATAKRDALAKLLRDSEPTFRIASITTRNRRRAPGEAAKLATARYRLKAATIAVHKLTNLYTSIKDEWNEARRGVEQAKAEHAMIVQDNEQALAQRRLAHGLTAHRPRGARAAQATAWKALRDARSLEFVRAARWRQAYTKLTTARGTVAKYREQIEQIEKSF
jgi:hypothetical protein